MDTFMRLAVLSVLVLWHGAAWFTPEGQAACAYIGTALPVILLRLVGVSAETVNALMYL